MLAGITAGATAAVWEAVPAGAHAVLQSTEPEAGSSLARPPSSVTLHFDEQVEVSFGSVRVYDAKASRVDDGHPSHPAGDGHAVRLPIPRLANGSYVVTWRVVSADSHPVHGAFTFRVGSGPATDTRSLTHRLLAADGGNASVGATFATVRALAFASILVLIGGTVLVLGPWPDGRRDERARRVVLIAWATALVTALVGIPLQGLYGGGLPLSKVTDPSVTSSVLDTRFGKVWLARAVVLLLLVPVLRSLLSRNGRSPAPAPAAVGAAAVGGVLLASSFGLASHPGTGSMVPLAVLADTTHVAAASVWIGGLALLTVCVLAGRAARAIPDAGAIVARFSPIALWAVGTIAATGVYQGWREVGSIDALLHTTYGHLLVIKLILFAGLLLLATTSRRWVTRHQPRRTVALAREAPAAAPVLVLAGPPAGGAVVDAGADGSATSPAAPAPPAPTRNASGNLRMIRRSVAAETGLAIAVLVVTSLLVSAQPGRTALAQPFSTELQTPSVLIDVTVDPAKAGNTTVHLYTLSPEGAVKDVRDLSAQLQLPGKGIGPIDVPLRRAGPGHFSAYGFDLPIAGRWQLTVKALLSDIDEVQASATVPVR